MPVAASFVLGTLGAAVAVWIAWAALSSDSVPIVGTPRGALVAVVVIGVASCGVAGIGQAAVIGWTHPLAVFGFLVGAFALLVAAAGLLGSEPLLRPLAGVVPVASTVEATIERVAIGVLAAVIAVKWIAGIPLAMFVWRS